MLVYNVLMYPFETMFLNHVRKQVISQVYGKALEIGFGTGANMSFYQLNNVTSLAAFDIHLNPRILRKFPHVDFIKGSALNLPFLRSLV